MSSRTIAAVPGPHLRVTGRVATRLMFRGYKPSRVNARKTYRKAYNNCQPFVNQPGAPRRTIGAAGRDRLRERCLWTGEHHLDGPGHVRNVEVAVRVRSPPQKSWSSAHQRAVLLERYVSCPSVPQRLRIPSFGRRA